MAPSLKKSLACVLGVLVAAPAAASELAARAASLGSIPSLPVVSIQATALSGFSAAALAAAPAFAAAPAAFAAPAAPSAALPGLRASVAAIKASARSASAAPQAAARALDRLFVNRAAAGDSAAPAVSLRTIPASGPQRLAPPTARKMGAFMPLLMAGAPALLSAPVFGADPLHVALKLGLAIALGTAFGLERQYHAKTAGLRTNILIAVGACIFMIVSRSFLGLPNADPTRIAAQIVTGIGFLGGGVILHAGNKLTGLTTAATIWVVAAIGMAVGADCYSLATIGTGLSLGVQTVFTRVDRAISERHEKRVFNMAAEDEKAFDDVDAAFLKAGVKVEWRKVVKKDGRLRAEWTTVGSRLAQEAATRALLGLPGLSEVTY